MRIHDFGDARYTFRRLHIDHAAHFTTNQDDLLAALERGLGLPDDVMLTDFSYDASMRCWTVGIIGPRFPAVEQGRESPQVQLIASETRIVP